MGVAVIGVTTEGEGAVTAVGEDTGTTNKAGIMVMEVISRVLAIVGVMAVVMTGCDGDVVDQEEMGT
ncbi:hypothetical protein HK097_005564, partial [Rhizophlyctis rosea]